VKLRLGSGFRCRNGNFAVLSAVPPFGQGKADRPRNGIQKVDITVLPRAVYDEIEYIFIRCGDGEKLLAFLIRDVISTVPEPSGVKAQLCSGTADSSVSSSVSEAL
jgi:hypothetical protein